MKRARWIRLAFLIPVALGLANLGGCHLLFHHHSRCDGGYYSNYHAPHTGVWIRPSRRCR